MFDAKHKPIHIYREKLTKERRKRKLQENVAANYDGNFRKLEEEAYAAVIYSPWPVGEKGCITFAAYFGRL